MARAKIVKKKKWIHLFSPEWMGNSVIGETFVEDPSQILGRSAKVSLTTLTGDPQRQGVELKFHAEKIVDDGVVCELKSYTILPSTIKRLIRKGKKRIDISFLVCTKDNVVLRTKLLLITKNPTTSIVLAQLNKKAQAFVQEEAKKLTANNFFETIIQKNMQKSLSQHLKKTYPLSTSEFRQVLISKKSVQSEQLKTLVTEQAKAAET
ncbi:hypothetical protein HYV79_03480 [Candidatus Woesearchaeota archaeon]|nr:hypothetical protein [Candidatus Woesearchaeota archaeon]